MLAGGAPNRRQKTATYGSGEASPTMHSLPGYRASSSRCSLRYCTGRHVGQQPLAITLI
jgi:hypothetical protein